MASYWKSQPRKMCEICKCWIGDNKASIDFHERGKSHQEKKRKQLDQIKKRSTEQGAINQKAGLYLKQMEKAAHKQYLKDLKEQGVDPTAYLQKVKEQKQQSSSAANANKQKTSSKSVVPKPTTVQTTVEEHIPVQSAPSAANSGHPFGKWTVIESAEKATPTLTVAKPKVVPIEFAEKRVHSSQSEGGEVVEFKKRKVNQSKKNRSIRTRTED